MNNKKIILEKVTQAAQFIKSKYEKIPHLAVILGTGLGGLCDNFDIKLTIPFCDIPYFPISTAPEHKGNLIFAKCGEKDVLFMQGRIHYYEGYSMDEVAFPVRVMKCLGIENLIITNAAGAINENFRVGEPMLISDHIKFFNDTPLRGENICEFGPRFNDMSDVYTKSYRDIAKKIAKDEGIKLNEGVYSYMPGPCFETPAEIRMLRTLGADAVGMSTVPETICASHAGIKIIAISLLTNMAAGITEKIEMHDISLNDILKFKRLLEGIIRNI